MSELPDWPRAWGQPVAQAVIRQQPEDFFVDEVLGFQPDGIGQHRMLHIQKRGANTDWVAQQLARLAGVKRQAVSYAGKKDRHAVTRQWYSVDLAGKEEPDWSGLKDDGVDVLSSQRHSRKVRRGALRGNRFTLLLRELTGDRGAIEERLIRIGECGVPNYFGEQRFGRNGDNALQAERMFRKEIKVAKRNLRGLYLSAARSLIFNDLLARRVAERSWRTPQEGEVCIVSGSSALIGESLSISTMERRLAEGEIQLSGPLWGSGELRTTGDVAQLEQEVAQCHTALTQGLVAEGLKMERRTLPLNVEGLQWQWPQEGQLQLDFYLPSGSYATALLREIIF